MKNNEGGATASDEQGDSKIQELEKVAEEWRKERIRNNLIIAGKVFETEREKEEAKEWFKEKMDEEVEVKEVRKLKDGRTIIRLGSFEEKMQIMKKKKNLKDTKVYIDDDLTKKEREIQKKILRTEAIGKELKGEERA